MAAKFERTLSPVLTVSSFLFGFPFAKIGNMTYIFSWKRYLLCIIMGFLGLAECLFILYSVFFGIDLSTITFTMILDTFMPLFFTSCSWVIVVLQYYSQREELPTIIAEMYSIDRQIDSVDYSRKYVVISFAFQCYAIFLTCLAVLLNSSSLSFTIMNPLTVFVFFIFSTQPLMVITQYIVMLSVIQDQIASLTFKLCRADLLQVRRLVDIHYNLCSLAGRLNKTYECYLLQAITTTFLFVVMKIFIIIVCIVKPGVYADYRTLIISFCVFFVHFMKIIIVVAVSEGASGSSKNFNAKLYDLMLDRKTLGDDNRLRTYISMNFYINQSAYGLDFNNQLLTSMAAASVTNIILLVQFTLLQ